MSETITAPAVDTTNANTDTKPARKRAPKSDRVEHAAAIIAYAKLKNVDTTKGGKLFRAKLRANFDTIAKQDGAHYGPKGKIKTHANDKRPWGSHKRSTLVSLGLAK